VLEKRKPGSYPYSPSEPTRRTSVKEFEIISETPTPFPFLLDPDGEYGYCYSSSYVKE